MKKNTVHSCVSRPGRLEPLRINISETYFIALQLMIDIKFRTDMSHDLGFRKNGIDKEVSRML